MERDTDSNALWGMQFSWSFQGDYRIVYLDDGYTQTISGRNKRDYVWIMAREPGIPKLACLAGQGNDIAKIRKVPQRWP